MKFNKKILLLSVFLIIISLFGIYSAADYQNPDDLPAVCDYSNETAGFGCCSIVLQLEDNNTMMSYRRDSNVTADVHIEQVNWHGIPAIKQYKTDHGYFSHVIITNNGWVIGLGGIDDGVDSEICENITANMITDDNSISEYALSKIQQIKKPYGRGHIVIKAPNGNYGFATPDKLKTGKLVPGQYISIPNDYNLSRGGNITLDGGDYVKVMTELSQSDKYGVDRREIVTYDINSSDANNKTDVYISNEDGSLLGIDYKDCIDNIYINDTMIKGKEIPLAPDYKHIGSFTFGNDNSNFGKLIYLIFIIVFVVFVGILSVASYRFIRFIKSKIRRKNY